MHTFFASDKRSCKHTMTTVLIVQTLVRMKKKQNFSDEELMQVMGLDLPSSKSGTETHGETVSETMAPIFDEPESMEQPAPVPETERGQVVPLRGRHRSQPPGAGQAANNANFRWRSTGTPSCGLTGLKTASRFSSAGNCVTRLTVSPARSARTA